MKIVNIGNRILNNYLIETPQGYVVVDTGYAGGWEKFRIGLQKQGIALEAIKFIFLTHAHDDHAGFLQELMAATGATLVMHEKSPERLLAGHNQWIGGCSGRMAQFFVKVMALFGKGKHEFPVLDLRISDRVALWDGSRQFFKEQGMELEILSLPGHTVDHIGLLTADGELFCGDAAMNGFPSIKRNIVWIEDLVAYRKSWDTMIESPATTIYPSHGSPFPKQDLVRFREHLSKLKIHKV
jgi:glyoxylase-like metal-dependent hydrolase (beta-lactamase superfamily II)